MTDLAADSTVISSKPQRRSGKAQDKSRLLRELRKEGWRIKLKVGRNVSTRMAAGHTRRPKKSAPVRDGIRAALLAYRRNLKPTSKREQPCRAALRAYRRVRPDDKKASERVVAALVLAIRHYPGLFARDQAASI